MLSRVVPVLAVALAGCNWLSLAANALTYETLGPGDAGNIVTRDSVAYVTLADSGLAVVDASSGRRIALVAPASGTGSVDDVALDGELLFALDARPPGALSVWSLRDPRHPSRLGPPVNVPVGPFSGVSARLGMCIVSGGTSELTAWRYDAAGVLEAAGVLDLGRGQPDVLVASGTLAFVSSHYWGPYFGIDVVRRDGTLLSRSATLELAGAGFTTGGAKPANFPIELALLDSATLLVAYARGLAVIRVAPQRTLSLVEVVDVGGPATSVDAAGHIAVVAIGGRDPGVAFVTFDTSVPVSSRVRRVTLPAGTNPTGVALSTRNASVALVAARGQGVLVVHP
jgi:hypothetical protein